MQIRSNGIQMEAEISGPPGGPVLLLIMGLGMQLTDWPAAMLDKLASDGWRVIRIDNRDAGLSQDFAAAGTPNLWIETAKHRMGLRARAPYSISDMAQDTLGVLDALQIERAHTIGVSMGGMIAQRLALIAPHRLHSLVSIMSSSSARDLPPGDPRVIRTLLDYPRRGGLPAAIEHHVRLFTLIGSPAWPTPAAVLRQRVRQAAARGGSRAGTLRQTLAVMTDDARAALLPRIHCPTLVIHGKDDLLLPYAHGIDTARRIPAARLLGIQGMGHDLPDGLMPTLMPALTEFLSAHTPEFHA